MKKLIGKYINEGSSKEVSPEAMKEIASAIEHSISMEIPWDTMTIKGNSIIITVTGPVDWWMANKAIGSGYVFKNKNTIKNTMNHLKA